MRDFRVYPILRYVVGEYSDDGKSASASSLGIFENVADANRVAKAIASQYEKATVETSPGYKIQYPDDPNVPPGGVVHLIPRGES